MGVVSEYAFVCALQISFLRCIQMLFNRFSARRTSPQRHIAAPPSDAIISHEASVQQRQTQNRFKPAWWVSARRSPNATASVGTAEDAVIPIAGEGYQLLRVFASESNACLFRAVAGLQRRRV